MPLDLFLFLFIIFISQCENVIDLLKQKGRFKDAEPLFKRSLSITEQNLGQNHPDLVFSLNNLAMLYKSKVTTVNATVFLFIFAFVVRLNGIFCV